MLCWCVWTSSVNIPGSSLFMVPQTSDVLISLLKNVPEINVNAVRGTAENVKIFWRQKGEQYNARMLRVVPRAPTDRKNPEITWQIIPVRVPLQIHELRIPANTHGCTKNRITEDLTLPWDEKRHTIINNSPVSRLFGALSVFQRRWVIRMYRHSFGTFQNNLSKIEYIGCSLRMKRSYSCLAPTTRVCLVTVGKNHIPQYGQTRRQCFELTFDAGLFAVEFSWVSISPWCWTMTGAEMKTRHYNTTTETCR